MNVAIDFSLETPLGLDEQVLGDRWTDRFLSSGCLLGSPSGKTLVGWGAAVRAGAPDPLKLSVYAPDFFLENPVPWIIYSEFREISADELAELLGRVTPKSAYLTWTPASHETFATVYEDIQTRLADGSLHKAVPVIVRRAPAGLDRGQRAAMLSRALLTSKGFPIMPYGFWTEGGDGMIGVTPEVLFEQAEDGNISTMALAGTRRAANDGTTLLLDSKELHEHKVVVDGIVERLSALGSVQVGDTSELRLPALIHLFTPIRAHARSETTFDAWVRALHPTPAIGAYPIEAGWQWLKAQNDARARGRFGAPFGFIKPGAMTGKCIVAIRNVQWAEDRALLMAGCGIVPGSQLEREWSELNAKLDSIQGALGI